MRLVALIRALSTIRDGCERAVAHVNVNYSVNNCRAKSGFRIVSYKHATLNSAKRS